MGERPLARGFLPSGLEHVVSDRWLRAASTAPVWIWVVVLAAMLGGVTAFVYATGGTQRAGPHLYYLPVILATLPFGLRGALVVAVLAGLLCGPFMPLNVDTGEPQAVASWVFRALSFLGVGSVASLSLAARERAYQQQLSTELIEAMGLVPRAHQLDPDLPPLVAGVLQDRTFHPVFQPIYALTDGRLVAVEALARFDVEPYRSPHLWFTAAATVGLGTDLEIAVLESALAAAADLPDGVDLSVNASPATLADPRLLGIVTAWGHQALTLELTEHAVIEDYHLLSERLVPLRAAGVRIAVDDAGAGFASLQHIVQLAPEIIKLDMSLAQHVATSPLRRTLAGSLIAFAQQSGALLVVEGIEAEPDLAIWRTLGADAVQGYLVGRPGALPCPSSHSLITSLHHHAR